MEKIKFEEYKNIIKLYNREYYYKLLIRVNIIKM